MYDLRYTSPENHFLMAQLRMPTRSSAKRLYAFTLLAAVILGFMAGMALDAVSGNAPYYILRQTLMGLFAGLIAPTIALLLRRWGPLIIKNPALRYSPAMWQANYAASGFLTGILVMYIYTLLPAPPLPVGFSIIVYPIATTVAFPIVASMVDTFETTSLKERRTREIFAKYVSGQVVERLLAQREPVTLSGERRIITVLFSDIRGFSKMSQEMTAEEVVSTLNEYFTRMIDIVFEYQGTVDKFLGDGLMVLFGAPLDLGDEPYRAVLAAQAMQRALTELNATRAERGKSPLAIGIGLDTGETVTGNIGSPRRLEYTAIGVPVNNAFYLAKVSGPGDTLITPATQAQLQGRIPVTPWQHLALKGSPEEIQIYRVPV